MNRALQNNTVGVAGLILTESDTARCDDFRIGGPVVRWDDQLDIWRMWYYCRSADFPINLAPAFGTGSIATAISQDGLTWKRIDGPLDRGAVLLPS
ncbi:MAG: hypothetical protein V3T31_08720, partial [candidate division Zixibacteria bacterium]